MIYTNLSKCINSASFWRDFNVRIARHWFWCYNYFNLNTPRSSSSTVAYRLGSNIVCVVSPVTAAIAAKLEEIYTDLDVETYAGGQPVYDYIISVE